MKLFLIFYLFLLFSCNSAESDRYVRDDEQSGNIMLARKELISIDRAIMLGDMNSALSLTSTGLEYAEQTGDESLICSFKLKLAVINRINGNFKQAIESLNWVNQYAKKIKNDSIEMNSFLQMGDAYKALSLMNMATSCYLNANKIIDRNKSYRSQKYLIYKSLGMVFEGLADFNRAIFFYNKSLEELGNQRNNNSFQMRRCLASCYLVINEKQKAFQQIKLMEKELIIEPRLDNYVSLYSAKGDIYLKLKMLDSALYFYSKAEKVAAMDHDINAVAINQTKIAHIYTEKEDWSSAIYQNRKALHLREKINNDVLTSSSLANLGMNYYRLGKEDSCEYYLYQSLALAKQMESSVYTQRAFNKLVTFYIQKGDDLKALKYYAAQQEFLDSLTKVNQRLNTDLILSVSDFNHSKNDSEEKFSMPSIQNKAIYIMLLVIGITITVLFIVKLRNRNRNNSIQEETLFQRKLGKMVSIPVNILDSIGLGVSVSDDKEQILYCNLVFAQMLGYSVEELAGKNLLYITTIAQIDAYKKETLIRHDGISSAYETVLRTINGKLIKVKVFASPYQLGKGKIGTIAIVSSLSDEGKLNPQLLEIAEKLDRLEITQGTFLTDIIKEINVPLMKIQRVIDDFVDVKLLSKDVKFRLKMISSELNRIHRFDEDLRSYCEVKSGTVKRLNIEQDIINLLFELRKSIEKHFSGNYYHGGTLAINFPEEIEGMVTIDISRLERTICRLMDHLYLKSVTKALSISCSLTSDGNVIFEVCEWKAKQNQYSEDKINSFISKRNNVAETSKDQKTMPVALHMVKAYTEAMNGRFWFDESLLTGSKYYMAFLYNKAD